MAEVESIIQPDCVADNFRWKPVTFVDIHPEITHIRELSCQYLSYTISQFARNSYLHAYPYSMSPARIKILSDSPTKTLICLDVPGFGKRCSVRAVSFPSRTATLHIEDRAPLFLIWISRSLFLKFVVCRTYQSSISFRPGLVSPL